MNKEDNPKYYICSKCNQVVRKIPNPTKIGSSIHPVLTDEPPLPFRFISPLTFKTYNNISGGVKFL